MINAKELRIGNYVYLGEKPKIVKMDYQLFNSLLVFDYFKKINPIPLSEEILLKCGFEKQNWCGLNSGMPIKGIDYFMSETSIRVSLSDDVCKKGVQYFQNWYFFETGKELEINL